MKKITISLVSLFMTGLLFSSTKMLVQYEPGNVLPAANREDTVIFSEDFEDGIPTNWVSEDVTDPGSYWYISTYNAYGSEGKSWRCADPENFSNGGYDNGWYQVLDTPVISLPSTGNVVLSFEQFRSIEEPTDYQNFDGWDGLNVRIRTTDQNYEDAVIMTDCSPAYNCSSLYSFGSIHAEDPDGEPGIPGWGGSSDWESTQITIPAAFLGQDVIISFAFASDEAESTSSNSELTGIYIDEIEVANVFYHDGETTTDFHGFSNTPVGGDLWHAFMNDDNMNVAGCFDAETGIYNANMENYLTTQIVYLPANSNPYFDMTIQTTLDDSLFPNCDYFSIEVQYANYGQWTNWNSISNPAGDPNLPQVVFTGSVSERTLFSAGWAGYNDLSAIAGHSARFRIGFHANSNLPSGFGLIIDDMQIVTQVYSGTPPQNLAIQLNNDYSVQLDWDAPTGVNVLEYRIHRRTDGENFELIASETGTSYLDDSTVPNATNYYAVSALLDDGDTELSEPVSVFVPQASAYILQHDDGSSESGYQAGILNEMSVIFEPVYNVAALTLTHIQFYLEELNEGALVLTVREDNNGFPGEELTGFPVSLDQDNLLAGWNTYGIPENVRPQFVAGNFYIGQIVFVNSPVLGFDQDSNGYSYLSDGDWAQVSDGNFLLRTIIDPEPANSTHNDEALPSNVLNISNYPNPFNPETTIYFETTNSPALTQIVIYNLKGQRVKTLLNSALPAGRHTVVWNGTDLNGKAVASGVYLYQVKTNNQIKTKKMLLMK
ncbi:MAG TPA: T9SS type A sorting domain-containing protein [Candidatus Cloacimonadota bacterium]|nr:T9SS type A sorting domain-containing protein [Candidatus Cloacimonadota bacterium]